MIEQSEYKDDLSDYYPLEAIFRAPTEQEFENELPNIRENYHVDINNDDDLDGDDDGELSLGEAKPSQTSETG